MSDTTQSLPAHWGEHGDAVTVAGSIYAVPAAERMAAAKKLHSAGFWVHLDVIVDASGNSIGVSLAELARVRELLPGALLDVHIIVAADVVTSSIEPALAAAFEGFLRAGIQRLSLDHALVAYGSAQIARLRESGTELWCEISPSTDLDNALSLTHEFDGFLLMLIEPGTTNFADHSRLELVSALSSRLPVAIDGGVTKELMEIALEAGVSHVVAGRALFARTYFHNESKETQE